MHRLKLDTIQTMLEGEDHLLELIVARAPLAHVLDKICTALDVQVGNVVSSVFFSDDEEHTVQTIAQTAAHLGLFVFYRTVILSQSEELLGTFEVYCCFPRSPTPSESKLMERAAHLAALAIERHNHGRDSGNVSFHWKSAIRTYSREMPPFKN